MKAGEFVQQFLILLLIVIAADFVSRYVWDPLLMRIGPARTTTTTTT